MDSDEKDKEISKQIDLLTALYRASITNCVEMNKLERKSLVSGMTAASIRFLFDSVKVQFENTDRNRVYASYKQHFGYYCKKFLKSRGRSGMMLNLSEVEYMVDEKKIRERLNENHRLFRKIDQVMKHGTIPDDLEKEFDNTFISYLMNCKKKNIPWYEECTYTELKAC